MQTRHPNRRTGIPQPCAPAPDDDGESFPFENISDSDKDNDNDSSVNQAQNTARSPIVTVNSAEPTRKSKNLAVDV